MFTKRSVPHMFSILLAILMISETVSASPLSAAPVGTGFAPGVTTNVGLSNLPTGTSPVYTIDTRTFVLATSSEANTLDPALAYDTTSGEVIQNVYETLVFYDGASASTFVPQLSDSYNLSPDGLTWTFHIRPGVIFHNGASLTPSDVAYSFQRGLLQGGTSSPQWLMTEAFFGVGIDDVSLLVDPGGSLYDNRAALSAWNPSVLVAACQQVQAAVVADNVAGTVTMHLAQPWGPFLATIAGTWGSIMDRDWAIAHGGWGGTCNTWQNWYAMNSAEDPLTAITNGTGPFKLDHWSSGVETVLTRNNNYWRAPAQLERVEILNVPDDATRFAMLQNGSADQVVVPSGSRALADAMVGEDCIWNISTAQYDCSVIDTTKSLRRYIGRPGISQDEVLLNFNIAASGNPYIGSGLLDGNGIPFDFFSDAHIRKAFNYCFNWGMYIQNAFGGEFVQAFTLPLEGMPGYDLNAAHYTFNLTKCQEEFGLADVDHDGIPSAGDANDVTQVGFHFQILYNEGNTSRQIVAEILAANLAQINPKFVVDVIGLPWSNYLSAQLAHQLPIMTAGWQEDIHDPHNWYQPYLVGTYGTRARIPDVLKAQFQVLINQGVAATGFAARHSIYQQLNQLVYDNAPFIMLGGAASHNFIQRRVNGRILNPIFPGNYYYTITIDKNVDVNIGGTLEGSYFLIQGQSTRVNYTSVDNGPVKVANTDGTPIISAIRSAWAVNGVTTSFSQLMGLPLEQLSDTYVFPGYNNVTLNDQLRIANVDTVPTTVTVTIGGDLKGTYPLAAGAAVRINYPGLDSGPVVVKGTSGVKIISSIREAWAVNGVTKSFVQLMGLPAGQLSNKYVFPAYNNVTLNEQLRVGNVDSTQSTSVTVTIGGTVRGTYPLGPGQAVRINYPGLDSGPVVVEGTAGVNIISSIRSAWAVNGVTTSFAQLMGMPAGQLSDKYIFPGYNNVTLNDQIRIANVDTTATSVTVTVGGTVRGTYPLAAGGAVRINYPGLDSGPVVIQGTSGVKIISSIREAWAVNGNTTSFVQLMGLPAGQLSTTYLFPAYNNVTLNEQLRIGVP